MTNPIAPPNAEGFADQLLQSQGYATEMERYQDFRQVFLGSDQGRKVLNEIMRWGHAFRSNSNVAGYDPVKMNIADGQRGLANRILTTAHVEPKAKPTIANSKPKRTSNG